MIHYPHRVADILQSTLQRFGLESGMDEYAVVRKWNAIVGKPLSNHTRVTGINGTTLYVVSDDHRYLHHLSLLKTNIIAKIAKENAGNFNDIVFKYSRNFAISNHDTDKDIPTMPLSEEEEKWCNNLCDGINPEIGEIINRILQKDLQYKQKKN